MGRQPYWNISNGIIIDIISIFIIVIFIYKFYQIVKNVNKEKEFSFESLISIFKNRKKMQILKKFLIYGVLNLRLYKKNYSGISHGLLFWGMTTLFLGTVLVLFNILFDLPVFTGNFNVWFMSFTLDAAGLATGAGIIMLMLKRVLFPGRLNLPEKASGFLLIESWILVIILTGFIVEGLRISNFQFENGSFIGNFFSLFFVDYENKKYLHELFWWIHGFLSLLIVGYIPFSKLTHIFLISLNAAEYDLKSGNDMKIVNFEFMDQNQNIEDMNHFPDIGVSKLKQFDTKNLLDFTSCVWCGRCHEVCPAVISEKELSPKGIVIELQKLLLNKKFESDILENSKISVDKIFNCTTCSLCKSVCPAYINQPRAIMLIRQYIAMEKAEFPEIISQAHKGLEKRNNPFHNSICGSNDWKKGLDVSIYKKDKTEYLLWIGCSIAYEERNHEIVRAFVNILNKTNVSFGILESSICLGDPARQMGDDFMFNEIAKKNIKEFESKNIRKIITMCPHCYDTLKKYYPQLGGKYEIYHHTEILYNLMTKGKINLKNTNKTFTYHDPCYLGRYNNIYMIPRNIIKSIGTLKEMKKNKVNSFCCGGGGGGYWMEESGVRMNQIRAKEAIQLNVDMILTACPFCLLMLTDGVKKYSEQNIVFDIVEIVDKYS